jgi:hypothetical protein
VSGDRSWTSDWGRAAPAGVSTPERPVGQLLSETSVAIRDEARLQLGLDAVNARAH